MTDLKLEWEERHINANQGGEETGSAAGSSWLHETGDTPALDGDNHCLEGCNSNATLVLQA